MKPLDHSTFDSGGRSPDPIDIKIGANLRQLRLSRNLNQTKLAELVGITFQQVQKYENGSNRISGSRMVKFARVLEISVSDLFQGTGASDMASSFVPSVSQKATELARMHDAIVDPSQRTALRNLARTMAQAED